MQNVVDHTGIGEVAPSCDDDDIIHLVGIIGERKARGLNVSWIIKSCCMNKITNLK